jgi:hypothetical protein
MNSSAECSGINAFERLPWHDSKFIGFRVGISASRKPMVSLEIDFGATSSEGRVEIDFDEPLPAEWPDLTGTLPWSVTWSPDNRWIQSTERCCYAPDLD